VNRHLVIFASLFLFLWAAISIGCSSKSVEEGSDSSAPSNKSAIVWPQRSHPPTRYPSHRALV
jgi:hypothetical protein